MLRRLPPRYVALLALLVLSGACTTARQDIVFASRPSPGPFSPSVRVGNLIFLSGQIGTDSSGRLVSGGIQAETRQTMENIRAEVERNRTTMDRVVKCTAFLADMAEWQAMNEVYVTYFPGPKPARSALGASGLARGARVEIECIAVAS